MSVYLEVPTKQLAEVLALDIQHGLVDLEGPALAGDREVGEDAAGQVLHPDQDRVGDERWRDVLCVREAGTCKAASGSERRRGGKGWNQK